MLKNGVLERSPRLHWTNLFFVLEVYCSILGYAWLAAAPQTPFHHGESATLSDHVRGSHPHYSHQPCRGVATF